jgi:hypothetical protein
MKQSAACPLCGRIVALRKAPALYMPTLYPHNRFTATCQPGDRCPGSGWDIETARERAHRRKPAEEQL